MVELMRRQITMLVAALACLLAVTACGRSGPVYQIPAEQARTMLEQTTIPEEALGAGVHTTPGRIVGNDVLWYAETNDGTRVLQLWARLSPQGKATLVSVEVQPDGGRLRSGIAANLAKQPAVGQMFAALVREQVDSALTGRAFAVANVREETAAALSGAQGQFDAGMRAGEEHDRRERAVTIDRAYNNGDGH